MKATMMLKWIQCPWCKGWGLITNQLPKHTCPGLRQWQADIVKG